MFSPFESSPVSTLSIAELSDTFTGSSAPDATRPAICAPVKVATVVVPSPSVMPVDSAVASSSSSTLMFTVAALFAGTSLSIVTVAPASITTLSPSKSVATNTEARLRAIVSASPPPVASGVWSTWSSSVNVKRIVDGTQNRVRTRRLHQREHRASHPHTPLTCVGLDARQTGC